MNVQPVAARELRLIARQPRTYLARSLTAFVVVLISLGMLYAGFGGFLSAASAGRNLFVILSIAAALYVLFDGTIRTADCLSQEKRDGTLGLLFLTNLRGYDVVAGKLISRTASSVCCLIASLPVLGIALFLGGVTGSDFVRMTAALVNGLFFSAAWGMLVSASCRQERRAFSLALFGVLAMCVFLPAVGWAHGVYFQTGTIASWFLIASPAGCFLHALDARVWGKLLGFSFADSLLLANVVSWCFLAAASLILPLGWREGAVAREHGLFRLWRTRRAKSAFCRRSGDESPVIQADERPGHRGIGFWPVFATFLGAFVLGWFFVRAAWLTLPTYFLAVVALHLSLMYFVILHACRGPGEDQRSGVLELLLTTPLGEDVYLRGRMLTAKRRCVWPLFLVLAVDFGLMAAGCWETGGLSWEWLLWIGIFMVLAVKLVMDLYALAWVGFWQGLRAGSTGRAIRRTVFYVLLSKWVLLLGFMALLGVVTNGEAFQSAGGAIVAVAGYVALFFMTLLHACGLAISDLRDNLRTLHQ